MLFFAVVAMIISLQACIYRMDIPQGNRVEAEKLQQLKTGMTREQVEFLLGQAAINDSYHANKAHYVYYLYDGEEQSTELKTMVLTFENDELIDIEGSL
jgi:outer membrane protein assembly factor BamE